MRLMDFERGGAAQTQGLSTSLAALRSGGDDKSFYGSKVYNSAF